MGIELNNREKRQLKRLEKINEINCNGEKAFKNVQEQILRIKQNQCKEKT